MYRPEWIDVVWGGVQVVQNIECNVHLVYDVDGGQFLCIISGRRPRPRRMYGAARFGRSGLLTALVYIEGRLDVMLRSWCLAVYSIVYAVAFSICYKVCNKFFVMANWVLVPVRLYFVICFDCDALCSPGQVI